MCPNCVLNSAGAWSYLGPGLICGLFLVVGVLFYVKTKQSGEFDGDEEEAKYNVFEE
ncbi:MAG: hypothetical protein ACKO3R_03910 [bacterium]|jgi:hypothetical protein